jgi:hypothetical protein
VSSALREPPEHRRRPPYDVLFARREALDRGNEPADPVGAVGLERRSARGGHLDQRPPAVAGIGAAPDKFLGLELGDGLGHRLRPHPLGGGEIADTSRALAVEPTEDGSVEEREAVLSAQTADELAEDYAQLARRPRKLYR